MVTPWLPDIMEGIVSRVNAAFQARSIDPFPVFFDKGIYSQVCRNIYTNNPDSFPLIWLVMPFTTKRGSFRIYGDIVCDLIIAMPTDSKFSQQEREDLIFKPRLLPIYEVLLQEIGRERWFAFPAGDTLNHDQTIRPYWGGGDVNGADTSNLFKKEIDAIGISNLKLPLRRENCRAGDYPINQNTNYPPSPYILAFFDDIELIVGGDREYDPVAGQGGVIIPELIGKKYDVIQRGLGQLRSEREIEYVPDEINGGFALTNDRKFGAGDTYFIKIRPSYVADTTGSAGTLKSGIKSFFIGNNT